MRDHLLDLVEHTYDLGCIDLIKITGTDKDTQVIGVAQDRSVVVYGKYHTPVAEFIGTFGMPNLGKLKILLNIQEYKENAVITITQKPTGEPNGCTFTNASGDFKNDYRFMSSEIVTKTLKGMQMQEPAWHVEFEPSIMGIQRLKMQAQANSEESLFTVKTDKNDLKFYFGDHSTHAGEFVFNTPVTGQLKRAWAYPVKHIIAILDLSGDKIMRLSDNGAADIRVNSGIAEYRYVIPGQTK